MLYLPDRILFRQCILTFNSYQKFIKNNVQAKSSLRPKFLLGGRGDGLRGGNSKRGLKWGGVGGGSLRNLSKSILELGVGRGKSCS